MMIFSVSDKKEKGKPKKKNGKNIMITILKTEKKTYVWL